MRIDLTVLSLTFAFSILSGQWSWALNSADPHHPNPQFARREWLSLNGPWTFAFDDQDIGMAEHWPTSGVPLGKIIQVPFPFESKLSGLHDVSPHQVSWLEKTFRLPRSWQGHRVLLHFGAVHYKASVWLNGKYLGDHVGGQTPFDFELKEEPEAKDLRLTVRCEHPWQDLLIARGKQAATTKPEGIFYTRNSGAWQSIWLEKVGENSIARLHVTTSNQGSVGINIQLRHIGNDQMAVLTVRDPRGQIKTFAQPITAGPEQFSISFQVSHPFLWTPEEPRLYDLQLTLKNSQGKTIDEVTSYFGFREVTTTSGFVQLNGQNIPLKFVLDQGYWPEGIWSAPDEGAFIKDLELIKAMGFNGVRMHQKLEDPRFLALADRLGILVSSEFPSRFAFSPQASLQYSHEWQEAIQRDWNHPSIVIWVPTNESWGYPNLSDPVQRTALRGIYDLTKQMDPTRLVIDNDGWQHTQRTDLLALHDYAPNGDHLFRELGSFNPQSSPPLRLPGVPEAFLPGASDNGAPLYLSEFAGIGYLLQGDHRLPSAWGYQGLETNGGQAFARLASLYEALGRLPRVTGICLTQLTDVEQEVNGLVTADRVPKYDLGALKRLNDNFEKSRILPSLYSPPVP